MGKTRRENQRMATSHLLISAVGRFLFPDQSCPPRPTAADDRVKSSQSGSDRADSVCLFARTKIANVTKAMALFFCDGRIEYFDSI